MKLSWLQPLLRFKTWWVGELMACLPLNWRDRLQGRQGVHQLVMHATHIEVKRYQSGQWIFLESVPFDRLDAASLVHLREHLSQFKGQEVVLVLPECLVREVVVPLALEENLLNSFSYELDRYTPFKADQIYFDVVVIDRDTSNKVLHVSLVFVLRRQMEDALGLMKAWDIKVSRVVAPGLGEAIWLIDLLRSIRAKQKKRVLSRPQAVLPGLFLLGLLASVLVFPLWQKYDYLARLMTIMEQVRQEAKAAETVRQELDQVVAKHNFPLLKKYKYPTAVQLLEDVSTRLPDDVWISVFELKVAGEKRELELRGEAAVTGKVITALEASPLLMDLGVKTNPIKIANQPEIFHVGGVVRVVPPPQEKSGEKMATPAEPKASAAGENVTKARPTE